MTPPDSPRWHRPDTPKDIPPSAQDRPNPPEDLTPPAIEPKTTVGDYAENTVAAGNDGLTPPDELDLLMQPPKLGGRDIVAADSENNSDTPEEPGSSAEQAQDVPAPEAGAGDAGGDDGEGPGDRAPEGGEDDDANERALRWVQRDCIAKVWEYQDKVSDQSRDQPLTVPEVRRVNNAAIELASASLDDVSPVPFKNPTPPQEAAMYFIKMDAGSEDAARELHDKIVEESVLAQVAADSIADQGAPLMSGDGTLWNTYNPRSHRQLLEASVRECEARDMSPRDIIDLGVSGLRDEEKEPTKTDLLVHHYARVVSGGNASEALKEEANAYVAGLDESDIARIGIPALRAATNPDIIKTAAQKYITSIESNTIKLRATDDEGAYNRAMSAATIATGLADDAPSLDMDTMFRMRNALVHIHDTVQQNPENAEDAAYLRDMLSTYDIRFTAAQGIPADLVVVECEQRYSQGTRERFETEAALTFIRHGYAEDARIMAEHCPTPMQYQATLQRCWREANSREQVAQLAPRNDLLSPDDVVDAQKHHKFAMAALSDDPSELIENILISAFEPDAHPGQYGGAHPAVEMLDRLASLDRQRAESLAYAALEDIRQQGQVVNTLTNAQPFIDTLAKSGNAEYAGYALEAIEAANGSPTEKLLAAAKLAKAVALRNRTGS